MNDFCGLCSRAFAVGERTKVRRGVEFCDEHPDHILPPHDQEQGR